MYLSIPTSCSLEFCSGQGIQNTGWRPVKAFPKRDQLPGRWASTRSTPVLVDPGPCGAPSNGPRFNDQKQHFMWTHGTKSDTLLCGPNSFWVRARFFRYKMAPYTWKRAREPNQKRKFSFSESMIHWVRLSAPPRFSFRFYVFFC